MKTFNSADILKQLKNLGTEQTRKTYLRHGASEPLFGVKFGDLRPLAKKIGTDQPLANELWETGNSDAMTLALLIADQNSIKSGQFDKWLKTASYYLLVDMIADLAAKSPYASSKWKKWSVSKREKPLAAAYGLLSSWLVQDSDSVPIAYVDAALNSIETSIHDQPNRARHMMNQALIAIGIYLPEKRKLALKIADSIGKVDVDHGDTSCKTQDARKYIEKSVARRKK